MQPAGDINGTRKRLISTKICVSGPLNNLWTWAHGLVDPLVEEHPSGFVRSDPVN